MTNSMIAPVFAMMFLTVCIWVYMYITRLFFMQAKNIDPQQVRTPNLMEVALPEKIMNPSNNLKNLFEVPVIFYVVCLIIEMQGLNSPTLYIMAWAYVVFRVFHSLVHCTYNKVMHRFTCYFLSCLVLWGMLGYSAFILFN